MSERDELVARLLKDVYYGETRMHNMSRHNPLHADAADQIERDKREIERLREALEACIAFADGIADLIGIDMDETAFVIKVQPEGREIGHRSWASVQAAARAALNGEGE